MKTSPTQIFSILILLLTASCATGAAATETPIAGAVVMGRVYLMDRDEPVRTTVQLVVGGEGEVVAMTQTDDEGNYTLAADEAGDYQVQVSVYDLLVGPDSCDNLHTEGGWPVSVQTYGNTGVQDVFASTLPMTLTVGEAVTLDCELFCD